MINIEKYIFFILFLLAVGVKAQVNHPLYAKDFEGQKRWVDSIYDRMTLKEKVGQLFMVNVSSIASQKDLSKVEKLIKKNKIGGIIFSKGEPLKQVQLTNKYQELSSIPLLIGMDAEWGLGMRFESIEPFPWNMTLGAIQDDKLIEKLGRQIARDCKRIGVHINFAPVVDINTNPDNPIIGNRSFGEDKDIVAEKSLAFMRGMQSEGVMASAKHFPGHGATDSDSHLTLPKVNYDAKRIDAVELYPFKRLISNGLSSVMVAHLNIPSLDYRSSIPSSVSKQIVTSLLKETLDFNGLVLTDALNMKGASDFKSPGDIDLAAFKAGNDILLMSENVSLASQKIVSAFYSGAISEKRLAHSVKKILFTKFKVGLNCFTKIDTHLLQEELISAKNKVFRHQLVENSLTVVKNAKGALPIKNLDLKKIAYVSMGDSDGDYFFDELNKYAQVDKVKASLLGDLIQKLKEYNYVIVGFHKSNESPWESHKFKDKELVWLYEIARNYTTVLNVFTKPYAILDMVSTTNVEGIVMSYQNSKTAQEKTAQLLFGAFNSKGKLAVSLGKDFPVGTGVETRSLDRLAYGYPESVGMNSYKLSRIDSIVNYAINEEMTPGVQLLVARKGKVVFNKSYGHHTYDNSRKVENSDVYDLASLTKVLATLPLVIELKDKGVISLGSTIGELLPSFKDSDKEKITLKDMLSHYARLKSWIPFYIQTMNSQTHKPDDKYYRSTPTKGFNKEVTNNLYFRSDMQDSLLLQIKESELRDRLSYKYSDLPFYLLKSYLEKHYGKTLNKLTQDHYYKALGANHATYLPLSKFKKKRIVPTEYDKIFRDEVIHGYVHDQGAAMQGGIGGHAGLFANANDVAKIMQMYLNGGEYGGKKFFSKESFDEFNTCHYCHKKVRRGIGFDKPQLGEMGPTCGCLSMSSFGHSGFTGTFAWADPEQELIYVFLSNRTYPNATNRKLIREGIRSKIQEIIYEAIDY